MRRIKVFISSSMFELEYEREITHQALKDLSIQPVLFEIFPSLSESPREAYLEGVRECDIFILILWKSFSSAVFEEYCEAVKRSKPILIFLKNLNATERRDEKLENFFDNFLKGEKSLYLKHTVFKTFRGISQLRNAIRGSVINEISKFYRDPVHTLSREEMYELGTAIINYAQNRLYIYQRTPILLLGARNYLSDEKGRYAYEVELLETLERWIESNYEYNDKEMMYLFSTSSTKKELESCSLINNNKYVEKLIERIEHYKHIEEITGYRFKFLPLDIPVSGPMIVGDNRYAIWILGGEDAVSISQENEKISHILIRMLKTHCQTFISVNEILTMFGIL